MLINDNYSTIRLRDAKLAVDNYLLQFQGSFCSNRTEPEPSNFDAYKSSLTTLTGFRDTHAPEYAQDKLTLAIREEKDKRKVL